MGRRMRAHRDMEKRKILELYHSIKAVTCTQQPFSNKSKIIK